MNNDNTLFELSNNLDSITDILVFTRLIKQSQFLSEAKRINQALRDYLVVKSIPKAMPEKEGMRKLR
jgi:hypothetical protein